MLQKVSNSYITQTRFLFYCHIKIKIPSEYSEAILDECFDLLEQVDKDYNSWSDSSSFSTINKNRGNWVSVDETTFLLLKELTKITELTNGTYSIALSPLLKLWQFETKKPLLQEPAKDKIQTVVNLIAQNRIQLKNSNVKIEKGLALSTGSFIKAYAVDLVVQKLKAGGITAALINAGGSTIVALNNNKQPFWTINIPHPVKLDSFITQLNLSNSCFSLSGCKTNSKTINQKKYATILNAQTGYPSSNLQTGVLTQTAFIGDVLSTALFTLEPEDLITTKLEQEYDFKAYLISENWNEETINFINSTPQDFNL